jgi:hypothetical protein
MYVLEAPLGKVVVREIDFTALGGRELGILRSGFNGGSSLRIGFTAE